MSATSIAPETNPPPISWIRRLGCGAALSVVLLFGGLIALKAETEFYRPTIVSLGRNIQSADLPLTFPLPTEQCAFSYVALEFPRPQYATLIAVPPHVRDAEVRGGATQVVEGELSLIVQTNNASEELEYFEGPLTGGDVWYDRRLRASGGDSNIPHEDASLSLRGQRLPRGIIIRELFLVCGQNATGRPPK